MDRVTNLTAVELIDKIREQAIPVSDVMQSVIDRVSQTKQLNAFINSNDAHVLSRAERLDGKLSLQDPSPLRGLPIVIKDNIDTRDYATTGGTPALINNFPEANAAVVDKLVNAGVVIIGKTNLHELAYGITNNNGFFGPVHNPYNHALIAGGSSGGTAAAVAARIAPVGLGTDTGGSVRIPAALCGVCGYRPSSGRYSGQGLINISHTRDTVGTFARSVADIQLIDEVLSDDGRRENAAIENLRIGIPDVPFYAGLDNAVAEVIQLTLERLSSARLTLLHRNIEGIYELNEKVGFPIVLHETIPDLRRYISSQYIRNCEPSANAGIPSLSIPAGLTEDKLTVGISIDGPAGSDRKLLAIGIAIQEILPEIAGPDI